VVTFSILQVYLERLTTANSQDDSYRFPSRKFHNLFMMPSYYLHIAALYLT